MSNTPESVRIAPASVRVVNRGDSRQPTASIRIPHAVLGAIKETWVTKDRLVRVQHFASGLIVVGHPDVLMSDHPRTAETRDYRLGPYAGDELSLPPSVVYDPRYANSPTSVSVVHGFDQRALILPTEAVDSLVLTVAPTEALGRLAHAAIAKDGGRNPIDITQAVTDISAALTPQMVYLSYPEARQAH